jgi:serine/threonine-protein kinase
MLKTSGPLSGDEVVRLGLDITDAVKSLWDLGKVHRDIKPGNVMRREESGDYVLLDAGLAFDIVGDSLSQGLLVGTLAYFSPEQFDYTSRRSGLDFRSDMFSLGATMYEAATGKHPFWEPGVNSAKLHSRIMLPKPPPPSTLIANFPSALDDIILRMLGKSQHLRFRTCDRLIQALREV